MTDDEEERRFAELRALKKGWDSYESYPIQDGVEARAKAILATLRTKPFICPTGEGGICLEWRTDGDDSLEIDVSPDGLSAFIESRELEDASAPDGPLARHERAMVIIEGCGKRIYELEAGRERELHTLNEVLERLRKLTEQNVIIPNEEFARTQRIVKAAEALVEADQAKPALGQSISVWRASRRQLLDALTREVRGEQG